MAGPIGLRGDRGFAGSLGEKGERGVAGPIELKGCARSHWTEGGLWCCWFTRSERREGCGLIRTEGVWQVPLN